MAISKEKKSSGKGSNLFQMILVAMTVAVLSAIALNAYANYLNKAKIAAVIVPLTELYTKISEERSSGKRWNRADWDLKKFSSRYTKTLAFSKSGVIMAQFNHELKDLEGKWLFFVPALRTEGTRFKYLDLSTPDYDMIFPLFWICGIPQQDGVPPEKMDTTCRTILGPEYQPPF